MPSLRREYWRAEWTGTRHRALQASRSSRKNVDGQLNRLFSTEVRDYVYQALLALVRVHAQVNSVAKPLLERAMNSLVEDLTSEAFTCFQKVEKFGMGGMLRVRALSSRAKHVSDLSREPGYPRNRIYSPDTRPIRLSSGI
jgi:hypothetical protein